MPEQTSQTQPATKSTNGHQQPAKEIRFGPDQFKHDWKYALRHLEKGESPGKVEKSIAAFRKDQSNPEQYAATTVAKVQTYLEVQQQLRTTAPEQEAGRTTAEIASLDEHQRRLADLDYARQLLDNRTDTTQVMDSLQKERGCAPEEAVEIASQANQQWIAERDLEYAIRARERGDGDDRIVPAIAAYRDGQVADPQQYAQQISSAAYQARDAERILPSAALSMQHIEIAQRQYGRDVAYAVARLEERPPANVRLEMQERRPEKALTNPSARVYGQPDHSYTVAVVQQAEKIRAVGDHFGEHLQLALRISQNEFGRHLREAVKARNEGNTRSEVIERISEKMPSQESYARAVVNEADNARELARENSIRPELARTALEHSVQPNLAMQAQAIPAGAER